MPAGTDGTVNVGSLFSGIGGMDAGFAAAGHRHVFFCEGSPAPDESRRERDPGTYQRELAEYRSGEYRQAVLAARFPGVPVFTDVASLRVEPAPRAEGNERRTVSDGAGRIYTVTVPDLLAFGFPCQDLSVAGRRAGIEGSRSGLFFEAARIIDSFRPRWLLVENVPGLLSSQGGRDFGVVLGTLADLGYGVGWRVLDSRFFGVPQRRRRVFIVGARADGDPAAAAGRAGEILAVGSRCPGHPPTGTQEGPGAADASTVSTLSSSGKSGGWRVGADEAAGGQLVSHSLTSAGFDASEDGTGRGTPLVARALTSAADRQDGTVDTYIAAPLTKGSATGEGVNPPGRRQEDDVNIVAYSVTLASDPISARELAQPSTKRNGDPGVVMNAAGVRRLTPIECERLQGLPDNWTRLDAKTPDSRRYSALGDAVTASAAEWIGRRLPA
jgi:DNA (cytosine-5)-methyltransferase 1